MIRSGFLRQASASVAMLAVVTLALGFGYPLAVTGISQLFFRHQAHDAGPQRRGGVACRFHLDGHERAEVRQHRPYDLADQVSLAGEVVGDQPRA